MKEKERSAAKSRRQWAAVLIKKYPNRRLYNTSSRAYVNLEDLAALIRQGQDIQVVDAKTGEDVTRVVLTQIIVEDAREAPAGLPIELLRQLIMASDRAGRDFIMWYLKSALDAYGKVQGAVQTAALSPLQMVKGLFSPPAEPQPDPEVEQLRRRVAELEQLLAKPSAPRKRRKS